MACKHGSESHKSLIDKIFAAGKVEAAAMNRRRICLAASDCGWPCVRLVKGVGLQVFCVNDSEPHTDLRKALPDQSFACPEGEF